MVDLKPQTPADNPLDYLTDDYLKPCVRWLDKSDRMGVVDRDTLWVPVKHTVDFLNISFYFDAFNINTTHKPLQV